MFGTRPKDMELGTPPTDSVSKLEFSPAGPHLAVGSWDNAVRLYDVSPQGQNQPKAMYNHEGPVLDLTWSSNGQYVISAGCDNAARMYDMNAGGSTSQQVAAHDAPIKCVEMAEVNGTQVLVTAGWDKKLKDTEPCWTGRFEREGIFNERGAEAPSTFPFGAGLGEEAKYEVVATAERKIDIFNLDNPMAMWRSIESPLKWQTRVVSCFPTGDAYAVGSVEGRVAIQYPGEEDRPVIPGQQSKNFSFKCHRYDIPLSSMPGTPNTGNNGINGQPSQHVFAVNSITFHKTEGTFATGGADGGITFWDGIARTRLKTFTPKDLNNGNTDDPRKPVWGLPVVSTSFNHIHEIFAYALAYDWSKGHSGVPPAGQPVNRIMLHPVQKEEVQKKPPKAK